MTTERIKYTILSIFPHTFFYTSKKCLYSKYCLYFLISSFTFSILIEKINKELIEKIFRFFALKCVYMYIYVRIQFNLNY